MHGYDTSSPGRGGRSSKASRETFHKSVQPNLTQRQSEWLAALKTFPGARATGKQVARRMGRDFNCVSGRARELSRLGLVRYTGEHAADGEFVEAVVDGAQAGLFGEAE